MYSKLLIPILFILGGCFSANLATKPRLTANGKTHNSWIENRQPPKYGDGLEAGCVVQNEFEIHLQIKRHGLGGVIKDVDNHQPIRNAVIEIEKKNGSLVFTTSDSTGKFNIPADNNIKSLSVTSLGYRKLQIRPKLKVE